MRGKVYGVHPLRSMGWSYSWGPGPRNPLSASEWIIMDHNGNYGMGCRVYSHVVAVLILSCIDYADLQGSSDLINVLCHTNCGTLPWFFLSLAVFPTYAKSAFAPSCVFRTQSSALAALPRAHPVNHLSYFHVRHSNRKWCRLLTLPACWTCQGIHLANAMEILV